MAHKVPKTRENKKLEAKTESNGKRPKRRRYFTRETKRRATKSKTERGGQMPPLQYIENGGGSICLLYTSDAADE